MAPPFLRAVPGLRHTVTSYQIIKPANYQPYLNSPSLSIFVVYEIEEKLRKNVLQTLSVLGDGKLHLIVLMTDRV